MFDMVFPVQRCDVRSSKGSSTLVTKQIKSSEVVGLAQRILAVTVFIVDRKEFRGHDLPAVLDDHQLKRIALIF